MKNEINNQNINHIYIYFYKKISLNELLINTTRHFVSIFLKEIGNAKTVKETRKPVPRNMPTPSTQKKKNIINHMMQPTSVTNHPSLFIKIKLHHTRGLLQSKTYPPRVPLQP